MRSAPHVGDEMELSPEQVAVLKTASPAELAFVVSFARNYLNGRKFACWTARAVVALGAIGGAVTVIVTLLRSIGWLKS